MGWGRVSVTEHLRSNLEALGLIPSTTINQSISKQINNKNKGQRKTHQANTHQMEPGIALLIAVRTSEQGEVCILRGHYIMTGGSILQEDPMVLSLQVLNNRVQKYVRQH